MINVLVVDDDVSLNKAISSFLLRRDYNVVSVYSGEEAFEAFENNSFNLVITDIMMSDGDGFELAEGIRSFDKELPIMFISAREDFKAKEKGYALGIDDYMVKPINPEELYLRVEALLRRARIRKSRRIEIGNLILDEDEHSCSYKGEDISLTVREFNIIYKLLSYPRKTFTRQQLMNEFWSLDSTSGQRTVDVYMTKLRDKLSEVKEIEIKTVHSLGYKVVIIEN